MKKILTIILLVFILCNAGATKGVCLPSTDDTSRSSSIGDTTVKKWNLKNRQRILRQLEKAMGKLPPLTALPPMDIRILDSLREETYTRYTINFLVAEDERLPAFLYIPHLPNVVRKLPAMLALHETDPIGKKSVAGYSTRPNRGYAKELAQRGYVVIAPDYPGFGDLEDYDFDRDRYQSGTMKGIFNHMRCIDLLQARDDVDGERIGVIGHSLGGHNAMFLGAFDTRLKVVVSSCGWTEMDFYNVTNKSAETNNNRLAPWAQKRYMPLLRDRYKLDPRKIPFDFDEVITAIAPRAFFSVSPLKDDNFSVAGVRKGIAVAARVYRALGAEDKLQVRYPDAAHDFPPESRQEAYAFIDKVLKHKPIAEDLLSLLNYN